MRILLLTAYFPPETGSGPHLFHELGTALVSRGHEVTVITGMPSYHVTGEHRPLKRQLLAKEKRDRMDVWRIAAPRFSRDNMSGRGVWQLGGALMTALCGTFLSRFDVCAVFAPPIFLGASAAWIQFLKGTPFLLNLQDLFPQSAIDLGALSNAHLIRMLERVEKFVYSKADHITVHSAGNSKLVIQKEAGADKVSVLPNWVDVAAMADASDANEFRRQHGLNGCFVVSFAGVLGISLGLDVVLESAKLLHGHTEVVFLIVGDGIERERLEKKSRELELRNVRFLPMQAKERYPQILHASEICLVTLSEKVNTPVVPSKIGSIMAAGRPVIASVPLFGDAAKLVNEAECGLVTPAGDANALSAAIIKLKEDEALRMDLSGNGRKYAEHHLSLSNAVIEFERLFQQIQNPQG